VTTTELPRLNNAQLDEIGQRLRQPLTDEAYRAFYRQDVTNLVAEVLYLRRDHSRALMTYQANPPLHDVPSDSSMTTIAEQLAEVWVQQEAGLWKTAENKKLRDRAQAAQDEAQAAHRQVLTLQGQIAALRTENAQIAQLQTALTTSIDREHAAETRIAELLDEVASVNQQLATLTQNRDYLQKVAATQLAEIKKRDQVAAQTRQLLSRVNDPARAEAIEQMRRDNEVKTRDNNAQLQAVQDQMALLTKERDHWQGLATRQQVQISTLSQLRDSTKAMLDRAAERANHPVPDQSQVNDEREAAAHQAQLKVMQDQIDLITRRADHLQIVANVQLTQIREYRELSEQARAIYEQAAIKVQQQQPDPAVRDEQHAAVTHQEQLADLHAKLRESFEHIDHLKTVSTAQLTELHAYQELTGKARGLLEE
jgi:hypothetical protein